MEALNENIYFANNLRIFMNAKNVTRKNLCEELDIKYTTFCDWINGRSEPKFETLGRLAGYLGVEPADFFIELDSLGNPVPRLSKYMSAAKELSAENLEFLTDAQINELLASGFVFKKISLTEYAKKTGRTMCGTPAVDWGEPVGDEIW